MKYKALQDNAIERAKAEIGTIEEGGNNRGPKVDLWLQRVHLAPGDPWCAAFVWCMVEDAARELGVVNPLLKCGSVAKLWAQSPAPCKSGVASRGIFCHFEDPSNLWSKGHTGFIDFVSSGAPGWNNTVEGNTNRDGSRDGNSVWTHKRGFDYAFGYIDLSRLDDQPVG